MENRIGWTKSVKPISLCTELIIEKDIDGDTNIVGINTVDHRRNPSGKSFYAVTFLQLKKNESSWTFDINPVELYIEMDETPTLDSNKKERKCENYSKCVKKCQRIYFGQKFLVN